MPRRRLPEKLSKSDFAPLSTCFSTKSPKSRVFFDCVCKFLHWFPSKRGNLHICRHEAVPKHHVLQCFQCPYFPKLWKISLFTVFSSIFQCSNAAGQFKHYFKISLFPIFTSLRDGNRPHRTYTYCSTLTCVPT